MLIDYIPWWLWDAINTLRECYEYIHHGVEG